MGSWDAGVLSFGGFFFLELGSWQYCEMEPVIICSLCPVGGWKGEVTIISEHCLFHDYEKFGLLYEFY